MLTKQQAAEKMDELIGGPWKGPRLWLEASEVPGLLDPGARGASKSEALQIKNIFFRGTRMLYRNPEAAAAPGRRPNPRGLPPRLSVAALWAKLGAAVTQRMQSFDFEALQATEAAIKARQDHFLACLRKTIRETALPQRCPPTHFES